MSVNEVTGSGPVSNAWGPKKSERKEEPKRKAGDSAVVSSEAKALAQKTREIEVRANEGFYDRPEVIEETADRILKLLTGK
jgi:hypothetical protein